MVRKTLKVVSLAFLALVRAEEYVWYEPEDVKMAPGYQNHPICNEIKESEWWKTRLLRKEEAFQVKAMDQLCFQLSGDVQGCKNSKVIDGKTARCEVVGAHSHVCRGNPCNQLNDGTCQLSESYGECVWFSTKNRRKFNKYWKKPANKANPYAHEPLPFHGCQRNPCNMAGLGKPENAAEVCSSLSVPGLYECTWCFQTGQGMGCQMTKLESWPSKCTTNNKAVKKKIVARSSVVQKGVPVEVNGQQRFIAESRGRCQCSVEFSRCALNAGYDDGGVTLNEFYRQMYPDS